MKLLLILNGDYVVNEYTLKSRDDVNETIKRRCNIDTGSGDAWVECNNDAVDSAIYIDTVAGTCETFKLEAKIVSEIVIT